MSQFVHPRGRKWLDLALVAAIVVLAAPLLRSAFRSSAIDADLRTVEVEAKRLYEALDRYYELHETFPASTGESGLDPHSLEPLRRRGYYRGTLPSRLVGQRLDAYDAPDDRGRDGEFWIEMTLARDPRVRFVVARSDDAPASGGRWLDGVFLCRDGELEPL